VLKLCMSNRGGEEENEQTLRYLAEVCVWTTIGVLQLHVTYMIIRHADYTFELSSPDVSVPNFILPELAIHLPPLSPSSPWNGPNHLVIA